MAFEVVMGSTTYRKSSDLAVGESIEGYLLGTEESKYNFVIKLAGKDGKVTSVAPHGNLTYVEEDIEAGKVMPLAYTKITRTGTRTSTKSRDSDGNWRQVPTFEVAQDKSDILSENQAAEMVQASAASPKR